MRAVGLDACRAGWIAVTLVDGGPCQTQVASRAEQAAGALTPRCIGVYMPVQLLDSTREADRAARRLLPGGASTASTTAP